MMNSRSEMDAILDEVARGRTEAFGRIVRHYALPLRSFLASQIHYLDDVDDLAQEVFLAALGSLPSFRRGDDFGAWLRGIARNKVLLYFRSESRRHQALRRFRDEVAVAALIGLYVVLPPRQETDPRAPLLTAEASTIATVIQLDGVEWEAEGMPLREGEAVSPGRLRLRAGRLTLAFFSGVSLTVEGPADLELRAADRVFFHHGKLRVRVFPGAEGFTVLTAGRKAGRKGVRNR